MCVFATPAISAVTLTAGLNRLIMSFKAPVTSAKTPILTYLYAINDSTTYIDARTTSTTIVVTELANNTNYTARVIAVNAAGQSSPSPVITKPVKYIYDVTNAPGITNVTTGFETATVAFNPPTLLNNSPVVKYQYTLDAGTTVVDVSGLVSPFTVSGLSNNVTRTIQLRSVNSVGASAWSTLSKPFVYVYTVPSVPTIGSITVATGGNVTIPVTAPLANGSPITDYAYKLNNGPYVSVGTTLPIRLSGLSLAVYTVVVVATNAVGTSANSASKSFTSK